MKAAQSAVRLRYLLLNHRLISVASITYRLYTLINDLAISEPAHTTISASRRLFSFPFQR